MVRQRDKGAIVDQVIMYKTFWNIGTRLGYKFYFTSALTTKSLFTPWKSNLQADNQHINVSDIRISKLNSKVQQTLQVLQVYNCILPSCDMTFFILSKILIPPCINVHAHYTSELSDACSLHQY